MRMGRSEGGCDDVLHGGSTGKNDQNPHIGLPSRGSCRGIDLTHKTTPGPRLRLGALPANCRRPVTDLPTAENLAQEPRYQSRHPNQHARRALRPHPPEPASQVPLPHTPQTQAVMATPVVAATEAVAQQLPRRFGNKQIFLYESRRLHSTPRP